MSKRLYFFVLVIMGAMLGCTGTGKCPASDLSVSALSDEKKSSLLRFYQVHLSPSDGDRCPMYPTCSAYAVQSVTKHGWIIGWIMTCDRLIRCGRDETRLAPRFKKNGKIYTVDPVEGNDFWWCEK